MKFLKLILLLCLTGYSFGQIGGTSSFPSLNQSYSARSTALGGSFITIKDADVNLGISNPALLNEQMHKQIAMCRKEPNKNTGSRKFITSLC